MSVPGLVWRVCLAVLMSTAVAHADEGRALRIWLDARLVASGPATIVVSSDDGRTSTREIQLDVSQPVGRIDGLADGDYDIRMTLADGRNGGDRVTVGAGQTVTVAIAPADGEPSRLRIARVDSASAGQAVIFDARALRDLPSAGDLWSLVDTAAPFVIADRPDAARLDTGGIGAGRSALVSGRGESWGTTVVRMDGLPVRLPTRTGQLAVSPDMLAAGSVRVTSGLAPIDVDTPGVVIDWTSRAATADWTGGLDVSATGPSMVGVNGLPHAPSLGRLETWRGAGAFAGGPVGERADAFVSAAFSRAGYLEREMPPRLTAETRSLVAHVTARRSTRDQWRAGAAAERTTTPFIDRWQFANRDVTERATFARGQIAWDRVAAGNGILSLAVEAQRGGWRPDVEADAVGGTMDRVWQGVVPPPSADLTQTQADVRADYRAPIMTLGPLHREGRVGVTIRRTSLAADMVALPTVAESVAGLPARVWSPVAPDVASRRTLTEIGIFAGDRWLIGPRFTVDAGLRLDVVRGANGGETGLRAAALSPRLSFRWSPSALAFFGGVGRYVGGQPLSFLAFGDPGAVTWDVSRWRDEDGNGRYDAGEAGVLVARAGSGAGVGSIDPDLQMPRTTEWVAGADVRFSPRSVLSGSIVIRRQTHLVGVLNTGLTPDDYRTSFVPDINHDEGSDHDDQLLPIYERPPSSFGRDALVLTNPSVDPVAHDGIEVTYTFSSPRWLVLFGATAYRTLGRGGLIGYGVLENDPLVPGDRAWNPNASKDEAGRLFFDRAYVGKWTTAYRAPGDVRLAAVVRYQDGQPFTRYVVAADLAGGPEITQAYAMGRTRFTYTATVDARLEKGFGWGAGRRASIRLDIFNLTNHANELEEDVLTGPSFRLSTIVQPPRTLRLGARLEF